MANSGGRPMFRTERQELSQVSQSPSKANYQSKNRANQDNRSHQNVGKFRRNIVLSETSSKSQKLNRNSFALLLHNTVRRCININPTSVSQIYFIIGQIHFGGNWSHKLLDPPILLTFLYIHCTCTAVSSVTAKTLRDPVYAP